MQRRERVAVVVAVARSGDGPVAVGILVLHVAGLGQGLNHLAVGTLVVVDFGLVLEDAQHLEHVEAAQGLAHFSAGYPVEIPRNNGLQLRQLQHPVAHRGQREVGPVGEGLAAFMVTQGKLKPPIFNLAQVGSRLVETGRADVSGQRRVHQGIFGGRHVVVGRQTQAAVEQGQVEAKIGGVARFPTNTLAFQRGLNGRRLQGLARAQRVKDGLHHPRLVRVRPGKQLVVAVHAVAGAQLQVVHHRQRVLEEVFFADAPAHRARPEVAVAVRGIEARRAVAAEAAGYQVAVFVVVIQLAEVRAFGVGFGAAAHVGRCGRVGARAQHEEVLRHRREARGVSRGIVVAIELLRVARQRVHAVLAEALVEVQRIFHECEN